VDLIRVVSVQVVTFLRVFFYPLSHTPFFLMLRITSSLGKLKSFQIVSRDAGNCKLSDLNFCFMNGDIVSF
jgi:hypothetical protein